MSGDTRTGLSGPGTRVLLVGTGNYSASSGLPAVPSVAATLADLREVLLRQCGVSPGNLRVLTDPASPGEVGLALTEDAEQAEEVLLVYYVGHGLVSVAGELYLATASTDRHTSRMLFTALPYTAVRTLLLESRARSIVVILDCCFSGRATGVLAGQEDGSVAVDLARVSGAYVLTSAAREELALAPVGARHTAFTGELIRLLRDGDPDGPPLLTLNHVYRHLSHVLSARGFPLPQRRASQWIEDLPLAANPAPRLLRPGPEGEAVGEVDACPYPGLAAFGAEQAQWFFGRERLISELVGRLAARLDQAIPLVVVGASGSGKSSLLRAGLLPALAAGTPLGPGSRTWPRLLFTPTADPVDVLAAQVARLAGEDPEAVRAELVIDPRNFAATVRRALRAQAGESEIGGARVVMVIDQFEETFTQCADERDRQMFIRALSAAAGTDIDTTGHGERGRDSEPPALVVLGMRADLYGWCAAYPELLPALQDGQLVVGPMRAGELRAAIERPAAVTGLTLETDLVDTLLFDLGAEDPSGNEDEPGSRVEYDPGTLPMLSHAMRATWEHRGDRTLTLAGYHAAGGIRGAVATTAERAFQDFDTAEQQAARRLLLRLIHIGDGVAETRRRVDRDSLLAQAPEPDAAAAVLNALAVARLVTVDAESVEITHEALLRAWPRLRGWIDADRAGLHTHQQLTEAAATWDRDGRPVSGLYRDDELTVSDRWAQEADHRSDLGTVEQEFLTASQALRARQERRRARRPRQLIGTLSVLLTVAMTVGAVLYFKQSPQKPEPPTILSTHALHVTAMAYSPDGRDLAIVSGHSVQLWGVAAGKLLATLHGYNTDLVSVAFSSDGHTLASSSQNGTAQRWSIPNLRALNILQVNDPDLTSVALSPDGITQAISDGQSVQLWDLRSPAHISGILKGRGTGLTAAAFSPDGRTLATASQDGTALWSVATHKLLRTLPGASAGSTLIAFSPDGRTLATGNGRIVRLWNLRDPDHPLLSSTLRNAGADSVQVALSPDGHTVATRDNRSVQLWDFRSPARPVLSGTLKGDGTDLTALTFSPDGRTLATGSQDGKALLWSTAAINRR